MVTDPIQDLRDVAANVTAHPHHVAIIAAAAVLHLADEFVALEERISRILLDRHIDDRLTVANAAIANEFARAARRLDATPIPPIDDNGQEAPS